MYLPALAVYLVDGRGLAGRDEQVVVVIHVYGVDVEVIDTGVVQILPRPGKSLLEAYVIQAAPLEEELPGLDVEFLNDALYR